MLICDTCSRAYHLQCLFPRRSVVPDGDWHCHYCDQAFKNDYVEEPRRNPADTLLFARPDDPFHRDPGVAEPLAQVCRRAHIAQRVAREQAREQGQTFGITRHHNVAEEFVNEGHA